MRRCRDVRIVSHPISVAIVLMSKTGRFGMSPRGSGMVIVSGIIRLDGRSVAGTLT